MTTINLHNTDNRAFMADKPDNYYELAIVDPPYRDKNQPDQWQRAHMGNMKEWQMPKLPYFHELDRVAERLIIWGGNYFTRWLGANNNWIIWKHQLQCTTFLDVRCILFLLSCTSLRINSFDMPLFTKDVSAQFDLPLAIGLIIRREKLCCS